MHANIAKSLVVNYEGHKTEESLVFNEIHERANNGYTYFSFWGCSESMKSKLRELGYVVEQFEHSVKVSW